MLNSSPILIIFRINKRKKKISFVCNFNIILQSNYFEKPQANTEFYLFMSDTQYTHSAFVHK